MIALGVNYLGAKVGTLAETRQGIVFEFDPAFLASGHDLSPLNLPLRTGIHQRDGIGSTRLLGLFEDSLPDRWGTRIMTEWFRKHGVPEHSVTPLAQLGYVGSRGMGALSYEPAQEIVEFSHSREHFPLNQIFEASEQVENGGPIDLNVLAHVGSPAGGARSKALIAIPTHSGYPIVAGDSTLPPGYEAWLVKFSGHRDPSAGVIEHAYALMARAAGIDIPETRLLRTERDGLLSQHFAVKRFDRKGNQRIHHHTLGGMTHTMGGDLSYETLLRATRRVTHDETEVWKAFRRAAFNVLASNRDDHGKNHGFIYDNRQWKLGPAYDLTFAVALVLCAAWLFLQRRLCAYLPRWRVLCWRLCAECFVLPCDGLHCRWTERAAAMLLECKYTCGKRCAYNGRWNRDIGIFCIYLRYCDRQLNSGRLYCGR